jgi:hypothetical protein
MFHGGDSEPPTGFLRGGAASKDRGDGWDGRRSWNRSGFGSPIPKKPTGTPAKSGRRTEIPPEGLVYQNRRSISKYPESMDPFSETFREMVRFAEADSGKRNGKPSCRRRSREGGADAGGPFIPRTARVPIPHARGSSPGGAFRTRSQVPTAATDMGNAPSRMKITSAGIRSHSRVRTRSRPV